MQLVKYTRSLYSIKYVFTNPNYRKLGVASGLLNHAFDLVNKKGGKKIFLTVDLESDASKLYAKLGFKRIVGSSAILTGGFPKSSFEDQNTIYPIDLRSKDNKQKLYSIYKSCMGTEWIDFFGTNSENIGNGFSQGFRHSLRTAFINKNENSFALVSKNFPILGNTMVELYTSSDDYVVPMLKDLFRILKKKRTSYAYITLLNIKATETDEKKLGLFGEMNYSFLVQFMGKSILPNPNFESKFGKVTTDN